MDSSQKSHIDRPKLPDPAGNEYATIKESLPYMRGVSPRTFKITVVSVFVCGVVIGLLAGILIGVFAIKGPAGSKYMCAI